jgi:hypothetical protein
MKMKTPCPSPCPHLLQLNSRISKDLIESESKRKVPVCMYVVEEELKPDKESPSHQGPPSFDYPSSAITDSKKGWLANL